MHVRGGTNPCLEPPRLRLLENVSQEMGEGWRHNDDARRLLEVALCASGRLGVVAYPGKPPTVIDEGFGHFIATVNPLVSITSPKEKLCECRSVVLVTGSARSC